MSAGSSGDWQVRPLTREIAASQASALLAIHNLIPLVRWTCGDLLADTAGDRVYTSKWVRSRALFHRSTEEVGGLMIAYDRGPTDGFPHRSLYLHRGAVAREHQGCGLGRLLFTSYFDSPRPDDGPHWLTLQTNAGSENRWIVDFYQRLGFRTEGIVEYPDKIDLLMSKRWV
ncbi:GNAT family N-acetyltransferase [Nocardioides sp. zg-ZUI104]|uniref:GNAT family N-acetyltransferase n=1 Tax=Nocardioides faecalis TaxID=2803858 RepID=UPI001BD06A16|nr:GNAT family N-acetyltransferase [Nocardioides faecalis]MBS4752780.1 GNAT family N-acetyltransferase [Nocardioides faecalis]